MTHTFPGIVGWPVTYPQSSPIDILVKECRSSSCCIRCVYNIEVRPVVRTLPCAWLPPWYSVSHLGFRFWLWIPSAWIPTPLPTRSVDTEVLILHALHGCWAALPQARIACSVCLNLLLLLYLYLHMDFLNCLVCMNFELLVCSSSLVLPSPISPYRWDLDFCFPTGG